VSEQPVPPRSPRLLVVQHEDDDPPALFGTWLTAAGVVLDVRRCHADDSLPPTLDGYDGLLVMGGEMGAYDDAAFRWLSPTKDLIREAVHTGVCLLGICLGHQLAAVALGGTVETNPAGRQLGVLPLGWLPASATDPVLSTRPASAIHWNSDVVTVLPADAAALATAPDDTVQAARFAPTVWGLQSHPEVDDEIVALWAEDERDEIGAEVMDSALGQMRAAAEELQRAWRPVLMAFAREIRADLRTARVIGT
jgi:GMP synthase (glutamine-hydrolysing)